MSNRLTKGQGLFGKVSAESNITAGSTILAPQFVSSSAAFQVLRFAVSAATTGVRTSTATIPNGCVIENVYLHVKTLEQTAGTKQISVGDATSASAFLSKVSTASAGPVVGSLASGSLTLGLNLLEQTSTASSLVRRPYAPLDHVTITTKAEAAHTELVADVVVVLTRLSGL